MLNNKWHKKVRPEIAERVKRTAQKYNSNPIGKGLALGRQFRIAVCVKGVLTGHPIIGAFSFHELLSTVAARLNMRGYALGIIQVESPLRKASVIQNGGLRNNDAVLFLGWDRYSIRKLLEKVKISLPYIVVDTDLRDKGLCYSYTDICESTREAISYFVEQGHKRIGFVGGERCRERFVSKLKGYKDILLENGLKFDPEVIRPGGNSYPCLRYPQPSFVRIICLP